MQTITQCSLCGEKKSTELFKNHDRLYGQEGEFSIVQCDQCGLIYLSPRPGPDEISRYYPEDYISYPLAIEDERNWLRRLDRRFGIYRRCREVIKHTGTTGRILDVGCATGVFLHGMQLRHWKTFGVEPIAYAAQYARSRFGLNVVEGRLEDACFENAYFDVVTLWDVLEHVPDPQATLSEVMRILKPGGLLLLSLPNSEAWERYWFGKYWAGWDTPRHFFIFTQKTLSRFLEKANFKIMDVSSFTGRHGVLVLDLEFWMTDWKITPKIRELISLMVKSIPARMLTYPFFSLADRLNKSSIMTVFARRLV